MTHQVMDKVADGDATKRLVEHGWMDLMDWIGWMDLMDWIGWMDGWG